MSMFNNNFNNMATLEEVWGDNFQKKKRKSKKKSSQHSMLEENNVPTPIPYDIEDEMGPTDYLLNQDQPDYLNQNPFQRDFQPEEVFNEPTIVPERPHENISLPKQVAQENDRIDDLEKKIDLILAKLNDIDSEPKQENIHDLILFVIFAVFVLFTMDGVYRLGKQTL